MKLIILMSLILTLPVLAKSSQEFNKVLLESVKRDIHLDADSYKKKSATRGPASVKPETAPTAEAPDKIDRNVRQIGPNRW